MVSDPPVCPRAEGCEERRGIRVAASLTRHRRQRRGRKRSAPGHTRLWLEIGLPQVRHEPPERPGEVRLKLLVADLRADGQTDGQGGAAATSALPARRPPARLRRARCAEEGSRAARVPRLVRGLSDARDDGLEERELPLERQDLLDKQRRGHWDRLRAGIPGGRGRARGRRRQWASQARAGGDGRVGERGGGAGGRAAGRRGAWAPHPQLRREAGAFRPLLDVARDAQEGPAESRRRGVRPEL